jgi:hypothetical protein
MGCPTKALALAAVSALCFCLAIADYVQDHYLPSDAIQFCEEVGTATANNEASVTTTTTTNGTPLDTRIATNTTNTDPLWQATYNDTAGNCLGGEATARLPGIWLVVGSSIAVTYLLLYSHARSPLKIGAPKEIPIGLVPRVPKEKG